MDSIILLSAILILCILPWVDFTTNAWIQYEKPIVLAEQREDGVYEFELMLKHMLSMSEEHEYGEMSIHDYEPDGMVWMEREKSQLHACLERQARVTHNNGKHAQPMNRSHALRDWAARTESAFPGMAQLHGRHARLCAVNGEIPGPTLVVPAGAKVVLRIRNRLLLDSATIHLHGQSQMAWFLDGVAPIQQCPVAVRSDFDFCFTAHSAGTHWFHGQFPAGHQSDGPFGAFVVLPPAKKGTAVAAKAEFQNDYVAMIQDFPLVPTKEQEDQWDEKSAEFARGFHGEFDGGNEKLASEYDDGVWAIMVNGKGWNSRKDVLNRPQQLPWSTFRVEKDDHRPIRLRLIHSGFRHPLIIHVERHRMELIASDGTDVNPVRIDALVLWPGERFDVRITTIRHPNRPIYRIVIGLAEQLLLANNAGESEIYGLANLDYDGEAIDRSWDGGKKVDFAMRRRCATRQCFLMGCPFRPVQQNNNNRSSRTFFTTADGRKFECHSVDELINSEQDSNSSLLSEMDDVEYHRIELDPRAKTVDGFRFRMPVEANGPFFVDDAAEKAARSANCSSNSSNRTTTTSCFYFKRFSLGKTVQITFVNKMPLLTSSATYAPSLMIKDHFRHSVSIHLHGLAFQILRIAVPTMVAENGTMMGMVPNDAWELSRNSNNSPAWKDTIVVPYGGQTVIRFRADNAGWWLAETQQNGRGATRFVFAVGNEAQMSKPPRSFPADCGTFDPGTDIYAKFEKRD